MSIKRSLVAAATFWICASDSLDAAAQAVSTAATSGSSPIATPIGNQNAPTVAAFNPTVPSILDMLDLFNNNLAENHNVYIESLRGKTGLQPQGVPIGGFRLFPTLNVAERTDSNIYSTTNNTKSDFYTDIAPSFELQSSPELLEKILVQASADFTRHAKYDTEDVNNYSVGAVGKIDAYDFNFLKLGGTYALEHEPRSSPDAVNGKFPTEYRAATANIGYEHQAGILGLRIDGTATNYSYDNVPSTTGLPIIETDRDRTEYAVTTRLGYNAGGLITGYVQGVGDKRIYSHKFDVGGFQRSSSGYVGGVGFTYDVTEKTNLDIFVGYLNQDFDDPRLKSATGLAFNGNLTHNFATTSVHATVSRTVAETTLTSASSIIQTSVEVGVDQLITLDWRVSGNLTYALQDYQGLARSDDFYGVDVHTDYLFKMPVPGGEPIPASAGLEFNYSTRRSNALGDAMGAAFDDTAVTFNIRLQI